MGGACGRIQGWESALTRQVDFAGKSGTIYRYSQLEENRPQPPAGANYVIAKIAGRSATILYAGETDNLSKGEWRGRLAEAREQGERVHVMTRLNVRSAVRQAEAADLIEHHQPPMNGASAADGAAECDASDGLSDGRGQEA